MPYTTECYVIYGRPLNVIANLNFQHKTWLSSKIKLILVFLTRSIFRLNWRLLLLGNNWNETQIPQILTWGGSAREMWCGCSIVPQKGLILEPNKTSSVRHQIAIKEKNRGNVYLRRFSSQLLLHPRFDKITFQEISPTFDEVKQVSQHVLWHKN
jgi:hypothetical protein